MIFVHCTRLLSLTTKIDLYLNKKKKIKRSKESNRKREEFFKIKKVSDCFCFVLKKILKRQITRGLIKNNLYQRYITLTPIASALSKTILDESYLVYDVLFLWLHETNFLISYAFQSHVRLPLLGGMHHFRYPRHLHHRPPRHCHHRRCQM